MRIAKWGNGLAVRLPADLVRSAGLKEGDEVSVRIAEDHAIEVIRKQSRLEAIRRLMDRKERLPADFRFDRDEAHER